jgi:hypothetical protein
MIHGTSGKSSRPITVKGKVSLSVSSRRPFQISGAAPGQATA